MSEIPVSTTVTRYLVSCIPAEHQDAHHFSITVERRGINQWAVCRYSETADANGNWEYEPQPSSREDEYLSAHRHTLEDALKLAKTLAPTLTAGNNTVQDVLDGKYN